MRPVAVTRSARQSAYRSRLKKWRSQQLQGQGQEELPFDPRHAPGFGGAHSDSAVLDDRPIHAMNRIRLRATCYIGDVPEGAGGLVSYILDLPRFPSR